MVKLAVYEVPQEKLAFYSPPHPELAGTDK